MNMNQFGLGKSGETIKCWRQNLPILFHLHCGGHERANLNYLKHNLCSDSSI